MFFEYQANMFCSTWIEIKRSRHLTHLFGNQKKLLPGVILFRVNTKDNVIRINEIWAHGFGFRANIDLLQPQRPKRSLRRSEVYETLKELINQHGFNGTACILKTFCDASKELTQKSGMLFKLFKLIFTQPSTDDRLTATDDRKDSYWTSNNCDEFTRQCPLWLLKLTPYTDI
ncbi:CLUMA_CG018496, isoform A [Clunio marinus]|uniref:CLUMA_CG018496, isoform A n=1 Tax=Clunio marinus TaxID=568069 RepID=A0A1J1J0Z0_9DIPT|nr:CLUMA_CG018496, isoform A [Clunio marinus]